MFGNNIKVHFAGCQQVAFSECCLEAGAHYMLFTVFGFICKKFGISSFSIMGAKESSNLIRILKSQMRDYRHVIMDSGLFTLMFGAKAGKRDAKFITAWTEELCSFVRANGITATCVEVDCQKVLGVEEAWKMRKRMKKLLPDNRIINVFHMEDGRKGLDRLIEYADYIAISVPELRRHYGFGVAHEKAVVRIANYIKNAKTISPKTRLPAEALLRASELKFVLGSMPEDYMAFAEKLTRGRAFLYVQPMADERGRFDPAPALDFIKRRPAFRLSLQFHKLFNIP